MTLEHYAYVGEIIAALAVIATLIYIGRELRQNTEALQAQSRYNLISLRTGITDIVMQSEFLLEALKKYDEGKELSGREHVAVIAHALRVLETWEWQYGEFEAGTLPLDRLPVKAWAQLYHDKPLPNALAEVWPIRRQALRASFVEYIEENVIGRPE